VLYQYRALAWYPLFSTIFGFLADILGSLLNVLDSLIQTSYNVMNDSIYESLLFEKIERIYQIRRSMYKTISGGPGSWENSAYFTYKRYSIPITPPA
jgi:hypothetical protein